MELNHRSWGMNPVPCLLAIPQSILCLEFPSPAFPILSASTVWLPLLQSECPDQIYQASEGMPELGGPHLPVPLFFAGPPSRSDLQKISRIWSLTSAPPPNQRW